MALTSGTFKKFAFALVFATSVASIPAFAQTAPTIDTSGVVNIRSGAATTYTVLAVQDGVFTITGRTETGFDDNCVSELSEQGWVRISFAGGEGWINGCIGELTGDVKAVPVVTPSNPVLITVANRNVTTVEGDLLLEDVTGVIAFVQARVVNVRQSPAVSSAKVGQLRKTADGETYLYAIGRNEAGTWVQVTYNDGKVVVTGWVARFLLQMPSDWKDNTPVK